MNKIANTLKAGTRAVVVATLLSATTLTAFTVTPAAAQPSFSFSFGLGGDYQVRGGKKYYKKCLSDKQLVRALRDEGYRDIEIVKRFKGNRVEVVARRKGDWWSLKIDLCSGEVYDVKRVKDYDDDYDYDVKPVKPYKPGVGLTFKFGY